MMKIKTKHLFLETGKRKNSREIGCDIQYVTSEIRMPFLDAVLRRSFKRFNPIKLFTVNNRINILRSKKKLCLFIK